MTIPEATPQQARAAIDTQFVPVVGLSQQAPYVTYAILGINIGIFLIEMASSHLGWGRDFLLGFSERVLGPAIYGALAGAGYANDPLLMLGTRIEPLIYMGQYWRLLTSAFLHPFWWLLAINMYSLFNTGQVVERFFGHGRFLALYLFGAVGGNILGLLVSDRPAIGSFTAISALFAGYIVFVYRNPALYGNRYRSALQNILVTIVINLIIWMLPGIDAWSVVGGMVVGIAFAWMVTPLYKKMVAVQTDDEGQITAQVAYFENQNTAAKGLLTGVLIAIVLVVVLFITQFTAK